MSAAGGLVGGCQCGKVRYSLASPPTKSVFCHCRMCQKAVGGPFAALFTVPAKDVEWTSGAPRWFQSSNIAARPFCADCGTPLGFRFVESEEMDLTTGSLDDPALAPLTAHYGVESRWACLTLADGLPQIETKNDVSSPLQKTTLISHQVTGEGEGA